MPAYHAIRQCMRPTCGFRFPVGDSNAETVCPRCGSPTRLIESPYSDLPVQTRPPREGGPQIEALLDNIRSTFNVGAMFRTADGAGLHRLHLCGITPTPDHPKIAKTSLGAEFSVPWVQHWDAVQAASDLRAGGMRLWALEGGPHAQPLFETAAEIAGTPILLVVGNEVTGVDPGLLALCEKVVAIPMQGVKESLNVSIAFGVAVYYLRHAHTIARHSPPV